MMKFGVDLMRPVTAVTDFARSFATTASNHKMAVTAASVGVVALGVVASLASSSSLRQQVQEKAEAAFAQTRTFCKNVKEALQPVVGDVSLKTSAIVVGSLAALALVPTAYRAMGASIQRGFNALVEGSTPAVRKVADTLNHARMPESAPKAGSWMSWIRGK